MASRIPALIDSLVFARNYTVELLDTIPQSDWFTMPPGCPSHIAWQVGHLTIAEARLVLDRVCGQNITDGNYVPANYVTIFGRLSAAETNPSQYPTASHIREVFDRVHAASFELAAHVPEADLDSVSPGVPHRFCKTKAEFLRWASHHEFLHTGHIGLIRRMLGHAPVW